MEKKTVSKYTHYGLGFPVILEDVTLVKVRGAWTPDIPYNALHIVVLHSLANLEGRLTGNQIRFTRLYFEMTLENFAKRLKVSHPAVLKWERRGDKVTNMSWTNEKDIRLFISKSLDESPKDFCTLYETLEEMKGEKPVKIVIDAEKLAA